MVSTLFLNDVSAKETLMDIHLTGISSTAADIDASEIGIGYGVSVYTDSSIFGEYLFLIFQVEH